MADSGKIYRMDLPFSQQQLAEAMLELVRVNELPSCYIRPIALRAYGEIGVNPLKNPGDIYLACWEWGKYLGEQSLNEGVHASVSCWNRLAPNTPPPLCKAGPNYLKSHFTRVATPRH